MKWLLDTHIWIWYSQGDRRLSRSHIARIRTAAPGCLLVSAISVWEIAMLVHGEKLDLHQSPHAWVTHTAAFIGMDILPLNADIALESYSLPGGFHGDPADRMIVATARRHGLALVTQDKSILAYAKKGHVRTAA